MIGYWTAIIKLRVPAKMDCGAYMGLTWGRGLSVEMIKKSPGNTQWNFVESCIASVLEFQYIFREQKHTLPSTKTRVQGITPVEIFEFCIVVGKF